MSKQVVSSLHRHAAAGVILWAALSLGACQFEAPSYDGTRYSCANAPFSCPGDLVCHEEACLTADELAELGDSGSPPAGDAASPLPDSGSGVDAAPADPVTVTFGERTGADHDNGTEDTDLKLESPNENFANDTNGLDIDIDADTPKVGLAKFDLEAIPPGSKVESAELLVNVIDLLENGEFIAHRLLEDWDEDQATFNQRLAGVPWTTAGAGTGSFDPTPIASFAPRALGEYAVSISAAAVQRWVDDPAQNFGWRWGSTSLDGQGGKYESSRAANQALRPLLRVRYVPRVVQRY
jgi:hypothetical protein